MKASRYNVWVERPEAAYVYNGMSGALLKVPHAARAALDRHLAGDPDAGVAADLVADLAAGRMLVADGADELEVLRARYRRSRHDDRHLRLTILTSLGCNFDCPYCFEAKHPSILDDGVEEALLALVDDRLPAVEGFTVTWFGGEPLVGLRPLLSLSDAFLERCGAAGVDYEADVITNGYLLTAETARALAERGVTQAQVGLDGPPDVHDRMRPLAGGGSTFWRIVENLHHAAEVLDVTVRVNLDAGNAGRAEELLAILAEQGLAGRIAVYPGHVVGVGGDPAPPSASYGTGCLTMPDFAGHALRFQRLAAEHGFGVPSLPEPTGAPCTAVKAHDLVVGSDGELYKCWDSVGNPHQVIGDIRDYGNLNGRLRRWLAYDPFSDAECSTCIALPVCMGGCAHHAMDLDLREDRCGTFRFTYAEQVGDVVDRTADADHSAGTTQPVELTARPG